MLLTLQVRGKGDHQVLSRQRARWLAQQLRQRPWPEARSTQGSGERDRKKPEERQAGLGAYGVRLWNKWQKMKPWSKEVELA